MSDVMKTESPVRSFAMPPVCTAAELRLRRHAEFQRVYNATKKQHGKQMSFFAAVREVEAGEYAGPRVGLTVGKVIGKAHVRNRIKRRLREAVRAEQGALRGLPVDVVLHPRRTVETLPYEQLRAEVADAFRRASRSVAQQPRGATGQQVSQAASQQGKASARPSESDVIERRSAAAAGTPQGSTEA